MPKKAGIVMVMTGAALILSALLLLYYNRMEDDAAGQEAENLLRGVQAVIQDSAPVAPPAPTQAPVAEPPRRRSRWSLTPP